MHPITMSMGGAHLTLDTDAENTHLYLHRSGGEKHALLGRPLAIAVCPLDGDCLTTGLLTHVEGNHYQCSVTIYDDTPSPTTHRLSFEMRIADLRKVSLELAYRPDDHKITVVDVENNKTYAILPLE